MNILEEAYKLDLDLIEDYQYQDGHHSYVFDYHDQLCIILDDHLCDARGDQAFDYSKYCEMQNRYMKNADKLYRFNIDDTFDFDEIKRWMHKDISDIEADDMGGVFHLGHVDNTPLEKSFEDCFINVYGHDGLEYLSKEYPISLGHGKTGSVDYVIETRDYNIAIEENGVRYHHPVMIGKDAYNRQLLKQNTLSLYGFKVYRFSTNNMIFSSQMEEKIRMYLGSSKNFIYPGKLKKKRDFKLYEHQESFLEDLDHARSEGITTSLGVFPTGTGKSQIVIEDLEKLYHMHKIHNALIMVPSLALKNDWTKRLENMSFTTEVLTYNATFKKRNTVQPDYYDYICFDEAHHAQAANCKKTLQYFTPKYLVGLTATDERLDKKKLEEIFGEYERHMSLQEAIDRDIITNIRCFRLESNIDLSHVRYNGKDYNGADLERNLIVDSRNELIVETVKKYFAPQENFYKQGIIFCVNVKHTQKLEKMFQEAGINARAVYGNNKHNDEIFEDYENRKVQFLLSCQLINEGWDSPQTEVVVMARPTLSKVLYQQQLGRGTRKYPGKECLYVIDVVDNYDSKMKPWSFNALFEINTYSPFIGVKNNINYDYISIFGLSEHEMKMEEIDVFTFEKKYGDYYSSEQAARELFIGTSTLEKWNREKHYASLILPIGRRMVPYFSEEDLNRIREERNISLHTDETILEDFENFIDENTLTYSFKLIFLKAMFHLADHEGEVNIDDLVEEYKAFYLDRLDRNLPVDRNGCVYTKEYLADKKKIKRSLLDNPFEKFERKRFVYYSKDLNIVCFNPALWRKLDKQKISELVVKENNFLEAYYANMGGL